MAVLSGDKVDVSVDQAIGAGALLSAMPVQGLSTCAGRVSRLFGSRQDCNLD